MLGRPYLVAQLALLSGALGRVVQVNTVKSTLKAPKYKRLQLINDELLSSVAFSFNLCRYN